MLFAFLSMPDRPGDSHPNGTAEPSYTESLVHHTNATLNGKGTPNTALKPGPRRSAKTSKSTGWAAFQCKEVHRERRTKLGRVGLGHQMRFLFEFREFLKLSRKSCPGSTRGVAFLGAHEIVEALLQPRGFGALYARTGLGAP